MQIQRCCRFATCRYFYVYLVTQTHRISTLSSKGTNICGYADEIKSALDRRLSSACLSFFNIAVSVLQRGAKKRLMGHYEQQETHQKMR